MNAVVFSPDGRRLASGDDDGKLKLWDAQSGTLTGQLQEHAGKIWSVAFSPDGRLVASGGEDKTVKVWDVDKTGPRRTFLTGSGTVYALAFDPTGRQVASGGENGTIKIQGIEEPDIREWLIAFPDDQFVSLFPKGRFVSSPGAAPLLPLVSGYNARPLDEAYRKAFQVE